MAKIDNMVSIINLAKLFAEYKIYPRQLFSEDSPVRAFQRIYPDNHYSTQIEQFLAQQNYEPVRRGADLPWWGSRYFSQEKGFRTVIISQDSLSADAGSIVFFANIFPVCYDQDEYEDYHSQLGENQSFRYSSWVKVRDLIIEWDLDFRFLYITDAAKVYKLKSWKDRDFDKKASKVLLEKEIKLCAPDLVIILGSSGVSLLLPDVKYGDIVDRGKPVSVVGYKTVVAPFPIGNGPTQKNYRPRLQKALELIKSIVNSGR